MKFVYKHTTYDTDNMTPQQLSNPEIVKAIQLAVAKTKQPVLDQVEDPEKRTKNKGRK
jgi:hypothetical protein